MELKLKERAYGADSFRASPEQGFNRCERNGRFIAFQMAKSREAAGVGHGIFIFDIEKASRRER